MTTTKLKVKRYIGENSFKPRLGISHIEPWGTVFSVSAVNTALSRIREHGTFSTAHIVRVKPIFAKNKSKWMIYVERR